MSWLLLAVFFASPWLASPVAASDAEVVVLAGFEETRAWLEAERWWGEVNRGEQLSSPNVLMTGISNRWRETAATLPVSEKKEIFYRFLLPLILHANDMVLRARGELEAGAALLARGEAISPELLAQLKEFAPILRIRSAEAAASIADSGAETAAIIDEMLYKLDVIPAGLALGQAAYESGYGTSRFAAEGNALFGQWTFGGEGLKPEQQRESLGDHRIAAFDWPFDSVRGYFINLMSHPAYEPFRKLRAERRAAGEPLSSLALADGLTSYSERGQVYVDTLKSIIRVNELEVADDAVLRDEPRRFIVGAEDAADAARLREEIEELRRSGELAEIIERMELD
ncbi:MAG: glucosaminidase domain-containing protein [Pseudomonadota bacterium]